MSTKTKIIGFIIIVAIVLIVAGRCSLVEAQETLYDSRGNPVGTTDFIYGNTYVDKYEKVVPKYEDTREEYVPPKYMPEVEFRDNCPECTIKINDIK